MLAKRSQKVMRWSVSAECSTAGFVDFVSLSLQSVSLRRRGGMADTSDLKFHFSGFYGVSLHFVKSPRRLCLSWFAGVCSISKK